jgi:H+/Cl- antiporter ClcA
VSAHEAAVLELGLRALALVVLLAMCALAVLDFVLEATRRRSLGQRFRTWSRRYPLYAFALILVVGALLSHFFWQEASPPLQP